jgi:hypothetical protein
MGVILLGVYNDQSIIPHSSNRVYCNVSWEICQNVLFLAHVFFDEIGGDPPTEILMIKKDCTKEKLNIIT